MKSLQTPPRSIMEVYRSLPEGTLAELINGIIYMSPSPSTAHQRIIRDLSLAILKYTERDPIGEVFFAPLSVYLDEHSNAVEPDIIFMHNDSQHLIKKDGIHGVPDLLIEILSPGNTKHDTVRKKALYAKFGVKEYWIVDPDTKQTDGFFLNDGSYPSLVSFTGKIHSAMLGNQEFLF